MSSLIRVSLMVCWVLIFIKSHAQDLAKADSLLTLLENKELPVEQKMEVLFWLATYSSSPSDELAYGEQLLALATKHENQEYIIRGNQRIGVAHRLKGNLGEAFEYLFRGANLALGNEVFETLLTDIYTEISACYTLHGDSKNALKYGQKTLKLLRKSDREHELSIALLNLGFDYYLIAEYDLAMTHYMEAEMLFQKSGLDIGLAYLLGNKALVLWKKGNVEKAKTDLLASIEMLKELGDSYAMADFYNQLGSIYLEENDFDKSINYTEKALEIAQENGFKEQIRDANFILYQLFTETAEYEKGIDYLSSYYSYKDSIQNQETADLLANLRAEFDIAQKQAEVDLLLAQKSTNQKIMIAGGIILLGVICFTLMIFRFYQSKSKLNNQLNAQKDSLIELNNTKDKFFSIISHDLRGPVNVLNGLAFVLKKDVDEIKTNELKDMLDQMETSASYLVKLLDNLLHWALQQRGHFPYEPEHLSIKDTLAEVIELFKEMAISKDITCDLNVLADFDVFADKNSTSAIFRNLLNNAIKFTPNGGYIQLLAEVNTEDQLGIIQITDNGVGIPPNKLASLLKLDSNHSTMGTSGESGLGLGLQLVKDFVQLNKGQIEVDSEEGKGTSFTVKLPLQDS